MTTHRSAFSARETMPISRSLFLLLAVVAVLLGSPALSPAVSLETVLIRDVPFVRQKPDFCGEACAEMYLRKLDVDVDQDYVFDQSGLDPVLGRGCYTRELATALKRIGFRTGPVWSKIPARAAKEKLAEGFAELHGNLAAGIPSIVCMHYDSKPGTTEHFRLVLGYDAGKDEVVYHEPAEREALIAACHATSFSSCGHSNTRPTP